jgi:hypothetical protein
VPTETLNDETFTVQGFLSPRAFRFSLRLLLLGVTCLAVLLAVLQHRARRQRDVVRLVNDLGGAANYEFERHAATRRMRHWADDYFCPISQIVLNDTQATDDDLAKLTQLPRLRVLLLQNTAITDEATGCFDSWEDLEWVDLKETLVSDAAADQLRKRLPQCLIETHWSKGCSRCRRPFLTRSMDDAVCPACISDSRR